MPAVVFDASAVIALLRKEKGADIVAPYVGRAAMSAVNLQELVKALLLRGLDPAAIEEIVSDLRLDIIPHDRAAAFAAAQLGHATQAYGRGIGDRSCLALAISLGVPALTTDREWEKVHISGLAVQLIR